MNQSWNISFSPEHAACSGQHQAGALFAIRQTRSNPFRTVLRRFMALSGELPCSGIMMGFHSERYNRRPPDYILPCLPQPGNNISQARPGRSWANRPFPYGSLAAANRADSPALQASGCRKAIQVPRIKES